MGYRRTPFAPGEWYHCFSRGIDKRVVFERKDDYCRFTQLLYLANDVQLVDRENFSGLPHAEIFERPRIEPIVAIGGWCLMRNHYHILLKELSDGGISKFMQKLGTGYTGYFNLKRGRIGNLFVKPFRSKHVSDDRYARRVFDYIHLNPVELFEPGWKSGKAKDLAILEEKVRAYEYSSLQDYHGLSESRPERSILDADSMTMLGHGRPQLKALLREMSSYYAELESEFSMKGMQKKR